MRNLAHRQSVNPHPSVHIPRQPIAIPLLVHLLSCLLLVCHLSWVCHASNSTHLAASFMSQPSHSIFHVFTSIHRAPNPENSSLIAHLCRFRDLFQCLRTVPSCVFPHGLSLVSLAPGVCRWIARYGSVNSCAHFVAGVPCLLDSGQHTVVRLLSCHNSSPQGVVCVLVHMMGSLSCICSSAVSFIRNAGNVLIYFCRVQVRLPRCNGCPCYMATDPVRGASSSTGTSSTMGPCFCLHDECNGFRLSLRCWR